MKKPKKSNNVKLKKIALDLPDQKIWQELEAYDTESSQEENSSKDCKNSKMVEGILDKAFELLIEKIIRQS